MLKKGLSSQILLQKDKDKVVFILHGFRGTPDNFTELSQLLYKQGYSVFNMRLPGHGFKNEDEILKVKLNDWYQYVENVYLDLADQFNKVYFCSLSLGAALQIKLLTKYQFVEKCVFVSPMIQLKEKAVVLIPIIKWIKNKIYNSKIDCSIDGEVFKGFIPFIPLPQVYEMYKLTRKIIHKLHLVKSKTLCILSKKDNVLNYKTLEKIVTKKSDFSLLTLEKSYHNSIVDVEKDIVYKKIIEWFSE